MPNFLQGILLWFTILSCHQSASQINAKRKEEKKKEIGI